MSSWYDFLSSGPGPDVGLLADQQAETPSESFWQKLNRKPKYPGFLGESPTGEADGGLTRPGSILGRMAGAEAPASSVDEAGFQQGFDLPPATNDPGSFEPQVVQGGVPLPRPKPVTPATPAGVSSGQGDEQSAPLSLSPPGLDAMASDPGQFMGPTSGGPAPGGAAAPQLPGQPGGGLLGNLLRPENAPLLLSLAGGFAGAGSVGTGMRRAFSAAAPAAENLRKVQLQGTGQQATLQALLNRGVPPAEAIAATLNPDVMKAVAAKYFETKPPVIHDMTDALGNKTPAVFYPAANQGKGEWRDMAGKLIGGSESAATGGSAAPQILKPGIKYDASLPADQYVDQFGPEMHAAIKDYLAGKTIPTGNARTQNIWNQAKIYAKTYADKAGIDSSDAAYQERLTHRREMASGKAGVGLQRTSLRQGLEHLESATKRAIDLGNYGLGFTPLTEGVNALRGYTDTQKGKVVAFDNDIQTLAGEVGKFFSSAQGGGVHERALTRDRFKGITAPTVLADAIDSTLELMEGGLHSREVSQQQLFGGNVDPKLQYVTPDDRARMEHIRELSQQLRTGKAAPATPATPLNLPAGVTREQLIEEARRRKLMQ